MSPRLFPLLALLLAPPLTARAAANPDFNSDAKPILARQPGLIEYIHDHFDVKRIGAARVPGQADTPPQPPFIFNARPKGKTGPYYLALLIQPGPPGRIMKVADVRKMPGGTFPTEAPVAAAPPHISAPQPSTPAPQPLSPQPEQPASASTGTSPSTSSGPVTSETPSGPVKE